MSSIDRMRCLAVLGRAGRPRPACEREPDHDGLHRNSDIEWADNGPWRYIRIDHSAGSDV